MNERLLTAPFRNCPEKPGGDGRDDATRVNFFMNQFRRLGFIDYNGDLNINNSLLSVVLRD